MRNLARNVHWIVGLVIVATALAISRDASAEEKIIECRYPVTLANPPPGFDEVQTVTTTFYVDDQKGTLRVAPTLGLDRGVRLRLLTNLTIEGEFTGIIGGTFGINRVSGDYVEMDRTGKVVLGDCKAVEVRPAF